MFFLTNHLEFNLITWDAGVVCEDSVWRRIGYTNFNYRQDRTLGPIVGIPIVQYERRVRRLRWRSDVSDEGT